MSVLRVFIYSTTPKIEPVKFITISFNFNKKILGLKKIAQGMETVSYSFHSRDSANISHLLHFGGGSSAIKVFRKSEQNQFLMFSTLTFNLWTHLERQFYSFIE